MDHTSVVRENMTEKYLLNELAAAERDAFEDHYFDCPECAFDVTAAQQFVEHSKAVLAEEAEPVQDHAADSRRADSRTSDHASPAHRWFSWLSPAFAVPALAALLIVAGYQNLVTVPGLRSALQPRILPSVYVNTGTYGGGQPTSVPEGEGLLFYVRISAKDAYVRYTVDLFSPGGKSEGSFTIPPRAGQDQWEVSVPAIARETGSYTMVLHGVTASGETKDLGTTSFQLQIQP